MIDLMLLATGIMLLVYNEECLVSKLKSNLTITTHVKIVRIRNVQVLSHSPTSITITTSTPAELKSWVRHDNHQKTTTITTTLPQTQNYMKKREEGNTLKT